MFGQATITTPAATADSPTITITSNLRLPGQIEDAETGLHYNFRRDYDPATGRYITQDPIGLAGGLNQYAYVDADPNNLYDPTGEIAPAIILIGTAARAYGACLARCTAQEVVLDALSGACVDVGNSAKNCALSCLNPLNWGGKGIGKFGLKGGKPYSNPKRRPRYGKGQRDKVWENAKDENGKVYDPQTGNEMNKNENWDMGHLPDRRYADLHKDYMDGKIDKDKFLKEYRDTNNYRPELPGSNRSDNARPIR